MSDVIAVREPDDELDLQIPESAYPHLDNVVSSFKLKVEVDLKKLAFRVRNAEYNPRKINAVVIRFREPRSTALRKMRERTQLGWRKSCTSATIPKRGSLTFTLRI